MHIGIHRLLATVLLLLGMSSTILADDAADQTSLESAAQAWANAFNSRDTNALMALTAEDVVLLDANIAPVSGRAARQVLQQAMGAAKGKVTTATKEAVINGGFAWRIAAFTHQLPNGDVASHGQALEIWKRVNGAWKLHRQMSSSILARPKLLPRPLPSEPVLDPPEEPRPQ